MIGFHEVRFPEDVSWGSKGGPVYKTQVFTSHRGYEKRNVDWSQPMMEFDAAYGIKTDAQILSVINFFNARQGKLFGFRYKNWSNYSIRDRPIATGDGVSKRLPMFKFYGFNGNRHYKRLRKIVRGTVTGVQVGADAALEGVDFMIDYDSGEIVFNSAVGYGIPVYARTLEFDEPVRFEEDSVQNVIEAYNNNALNKLSLVGIRGSFSAGSAFSPDRTETGTPDPLYGRTFLLLNFDSGQGAQVTTDQSIIQNPVTISNSAQITTRAFRHGNASLSLGGNGLVTTIGEPYVVGSMPFTVELFAQRPTEGAAIQPIIGRWEEPTSQRSFLLRYNSTTQRLEFIASRDGIDQRIILSHPWESSSGFFDHISVDRLTSGWYVLRINGLVKQTSRDTEEVFSCTAPLSIGSVPAPNVGEGPFQGLIDSIRITIGYNRSSGFEAADIPAPYGVT
ncbi:gene transfer agent [Roseobacter phage DSS3P8]|nr:gene transfer agent [Roseobacter phage DSS3P8]